MIFKVVTDHTPFKLAYGLIPLMPTKYIISTHPTTSLIGYTLHRVLAARVTDLDKLDKSGLVAATQDEGE